jgi:hypothetical protein
VVSELNLQVWGRYSHRRNGDAYSPEYINLAQGLNPEFPRQPYGYLFRIDVPANYPSDQLSVEIFDPDSFNRPGTPPTWPPSQQGSPTPTLTADMYASCTNPRPDPNPWSCTSNGPRYDTGSKWNAFPNGRPAFWRVDEYRTPYNLNNGGVFNDNYATTTDYTLWHFNPSNTDPFGDPALLSDLPGGAYLARYSIKTDQSVPTDLSWYRPPSFLITLRDPGNPNCVFHNGACFETEMNGGFYFYLYVQGILGSGENNYDLRAGPPALNGGGCATPCYVNFLNMTNAPDWQDGGAKIYARRALPLNMDSGAGFPLLLTRISSTQAGDLLGVRHFDQDCNLGCGSPMEYQMQKCGCSDPLNDKCWQTVGTGYVGGNDLWTDGVHPDPEIIEIPSPGSRAYASIFGGPVQCATSWLRIKRNPSYSQDTTTWEVLKLHVVTGP